MRDENDNCEQCNKIIPNKHQDKYTNIGYCNENCFLAECSYCPTCMELYDEMVVSIHGCECQLNESVCGEGHFWYIDWDKLDTIPGRNDIHHSQKCKDRVIEQCISRLTLK